MEKRELIFFLIFTSVVFSQETVTISWTGGEGVADIQTSVDLSNWSTIAHRATSPYVHAGLAGNPKRFYRVRESTGP